MVGVELSALGVGVCKVWEGMALEVTFRNEENPSPSLVLSCVLLGDQQWCTWEVCRGHCVLRSSQDSMKAMRWKERFGGMVGNPVKSEFWCDRCLLLS